MVKKNNTLNADKQYFTIGEVSRICNVKPHVLRYWEQEFPSLKPCKRRGNRRYYLQKDVVMVRDIKNLLYEQGFTIGGARQKLSCKKINTTQNGKNLLINSSVKKKKCVNSNQELITELQEILAILT